MLMQMVKEEPIDNQEELIDDPIIASYNIVPLDNGKIKAFNVSGLSNVLDQSKSCSISIRTDFKELKITTKNNDDINSVFVTKESNLNLKKKTFAVKFSRETGYAYFIPINSTHSLTYLDASNRGTKAIDSQNLIFEDCVKMPHPSRNKHDQFCVEMKNYLYKPLNRIIAPEKIKIFMDQLFTIPNKRFLQDSTQMIQKQSLNKIDAANRSDTTVMDLINCPYWFINKINLGDINRIEIIEIKIEIFLRKVQVIRFEEILCIFQIETDKLLNILQNICYLIYGNWVIKSHLLYKFNVIHESERQQLQFKKLIAAREYLLWYFAFNKSITVVDLYEKFKKIDDYEEILNRLTVRNNNCQKMNIEFILGEDLQFKSQYALLAKKHHEKTKELLNSKHQEYTMILNSE